MPCQHTYHWVFFTTRTATVRDNHDHLNRFNITIKGMLSATYEYHHCLTLCSLFSRIITE